MLKLVIFPNTVKFHYNWKNNIFIKTVFWKFLIIFLAYLWMKSICIRPNTWFNTKNLKKSIQGSIDNYCLEVNF